MLIKMNLQSKYNINFSFFLFFFLYYKFYSEDNTNRECIICFTDLIDTVIMPCRHMCICMECAKSI